MDPNIVELEAAVFDNTDTEVESKEPAAESDDHETLRDLEGPDSKYITLISGDGHEFMVKRHLAQHAHTIQDMIMPGPATSEESGATKVYLERVE